MTIHVRAVTTPSVDTTSPYATNKPSGTTQGDFLLAVPVAVAEFIDQVSPPSDWYAVRGAGINGSDNICAWYKIAGASEPSSFDFVSSSNTPTGVGILALYSDSGHINIDAVATQVNASGNRVFPSVTLSAAGMVICVGAVGNNFTSTPAAGMTEQWDVGLSANRTYCMTGTVSAGVTGTISATGTSSDSKCITIGLVEAATTYPGIRYKSRANTGPSTVTSSISLTMPSDIVAGNMLIAHLTLFADRTITTPTGWTLQANLATSGAMRVFTRIADGTEASASLTINFTGGSVAASLAVSVWWSPDGDALTIGDVQTASNSVSGNHTFPSVTSTLAGSVLVMLGSKANTTQWQCVNNLDMWERYDFGASSVRAGMFSEYLLAIGATGTRTIQPTSGTSAADLVALLVEIDPPDTDPPTVYASAYGPYGIMVSLTYDGDDNPTDWIWQWSANGTTGWTTLGTTDVAIQYFRHHPLAPATTYYYRAAVYDTAAGTYSAVVSATTHALATVANGVALWIDVRDSSNNKLGPGPLTEIVGWSNVRRLNRAGEFSVDFPATYARLHQLEGDGNPLLHTDRYLYCYGILNGDVTLLGAGIVKEIELVRRAGGAPTIAVSGPDLMGELRQVTVYSAARPWQVDIENSTDAPDDLITTYAVTPALPDDWTITGGNPTDTAVTAKFVHATLLSALIDIGSKIGEYFRLGSSNNGRELVWLGPPSAFVDCGVRAELSVDPIAIENNLAICLITNISEIKDAWDLYTKAFAFAAGQGHDRLDLAAVTVWPDGHRYRSTLTSISGSGIVVTVVTSEANGVVLGESIEILGTVNFDGTYTVLTIVDAYSFSFTSSNTSPTETSGYVYGASTRTIDGESWTIDRDETSLENTTARGLYGRQHTALQFKEISPITNSDADISAAANALWAATMVWMRTHDAPAQFYRLDVARLNTILYPGQTIRVVAKGYVEGTRYLNINTDLTILEVTSRIGNGGVRTTGLVVSTVERWPASDGDQAASEFHQAAVYQSLAQLGPTVDTISYREAIDDDTGAEFYFFLGEETVAVNSVLVRFRCDKLRSTVKSVGGSSTSTDSGGGATPTSASGGGSTETTDSGSGHTHEVDLADSTSGTAVYFAGVGTPPVGDLRTSGGGQINTSSTGSGHTHDVSIPSHTHSVTVPAHTHDVTAAISTEYGIYEDPGTAYAATDLEFSINGGAWRSDQAGISGASGWYALDITDEIVGLALRPLQVANSVAVRIKTASHADQKVQITAQIERRCVIQSIAQL